MCSCVGVHEPDVGEVSRVRTAACALDHGSRLIDAQDQAAWTDPTRREQRDVTVPAADIEHPVARSHVRGVEHTHRHAGIPSRRLRVCRALYVFDIHVFVKYLPGMPRRGRFGTHQRGRGVRCRWSPEPGAWEVRARVERFVEPALLLLLRDGETHGYDLADSLAGIAPDDPVDLGNLYRLLRSLEAEGVVTSRWRDDLPGRSKRTYELTDDGRRLLDTWADALSKTGDTIAAFLRRYEKGAVRKGATG
jgi:PadR family transcriptional regulator, regulatory protein PadR